MEDSRKLAQQLKELLEEKHLTMATCESLTCGLIAAAMGDVPGVSAVYAGGAVTYMTKTKTTLAGVDSHHLEQYGAVDPETAIQMCRGIKERLGTDTAVAVTGNAGPLPMEGKEVGQVYVAVSCGDTVRVKEYHFDGDRKEIRKKTVCAGLLDLYELVNA